MLACVDPNVRSQPACLAGGSPVTHLLVLACLPACMPACLLTCFALRCIALQTNVLRWVTGDPPAMQHCIVTLPCSIALQHGIAAVWLLACLLARGCIAFQAKVCRWVTGDPPANATLQCHIAVQHCIAALDDNMGLQYCTAESYCSLSLRNCITALHCSSQKSLNVSRISFDPISFSYIVSDCTDFAASQKHVQIIIVFTAYV